MVSRLYLTLSLNPYAPCHLIVIFNYLSKYSCRHHKHIKDMFPLHKILISSVASRKNNMQNNCCSIYTIMNNNQCVVILPLLVLIAQHKDDISLQCFKRCPSEAICCFCLKIYSLFNMKCKISIEYLKT